MAYHRQKFSNFTAQLSGPECEAKMLGLRDNPHSRSSTFILHIKIYLLFIVKKNEIIFKKSNENDKCLPLPF